MKVLTIIDTFGFFFRSYFALPNLRDKEGFPTGLLTGFANFIYSLKSELGSDYILFALDSKGKTFRHEIDKNYKATRPEAPEDLKKQLEIAISWIEKMGFKCYSKENYEADDVIASTVLFAKRHDIKSRIVSHDKDLYQLIDDDMVTIYDPIKKIDINEQKCIEKFGVSPKKIADYLSIVGDSADNIPGVKGIGDKGARKLLSQFDSLEDIYNNIDKILNPRTKKLLLASKESAFLSKKLVQLHYDLDIADKFEKFRYPDAQPLLNIVDDLKKYGLRSVLSRLNLKKSDEKEETTLFKNILLDTKEKLFEVIDRLQTNDIVAFDTETYSLDSYNTKIVGFSFALNDKEAYYVPIAHNYLGVTAQVDKEVAKEAVKKIFTCKVVGQNLKFDIAVVESNFDFRVEKIYADTMILAWLLNPQKNVGLDSLALRFFNYEMVKFKNVVKKGDTFAGVDIEKASFYASEDAWMTLKIYNKLTDLLEPHLLDLAKNLEFPFIRVLLDMEKEGIKVDTEFLYELSKKVSSKIDKLTKEIYSLCGVEFNLNSPKQLGNVLFDKMKLPVVKKSKTGYSTDENVLKALEDKHPVIEKILEYREIFKLKSTYIEPLLKLSLKDTNGRIHTSFLQTGTATGRLSSKDPNLQNIPVRDDLSIREAFIAKDGYTLIGIDYSQIELRLLAHFSEDSALLEAFNNNLDIHTQTALRLFGEEEAKSKRGVAKSINFGLLYGMGARKLAQTLDISTKEAKSYIESYFKSFPTVKSYLESIVQSAKERGFVETILKRRRYFDFENANGMQSAMYEREAVNTLFQGSAADLIKISMNHIYRDLTNESAKLLLQIHDELIFEVKDDLVEEFSLKAKEIMQNAYELKVPLIATVAIGKNWGELK